MQDEEVQRERTEQLQRPVDKKFNPVAVAEAMEDPEVFEQVARGDLYVQLHHLRQLAANPNFPISHRLDYAKFLAKMGKVEKPEVDVSPFAGVPAITIVLPNAGTSTQVSSAAPALQGEYTTKEEE